MHDFKDFRHLFLLCWCSLRRVHGKAYVVTDTVGQVSIGLTHIV